MKRLGHTKLVAPNGDWGAIIVDVIDGHAPPELLGVHTDMPGIFPADIDRAAASGAPTRRRLSADEKVAYERLQFVRVAIHADNRPGCWSRQPDVPRVVRAHQYDPRVRRVHDGAGGDGSRKYLRGVARAGHVAPGGPADRRNSSSGVVRLRRHRVQDGAIRRPSIRFRGPREVLSSFDAVGRMGRR